MIAHICLIPPKLELVNWFFSFFSITTRPRGRGRGRARKFVEVVKDGKTLQIKLGECFSCNLMNDWFFELIKLIFYLIQTMPMKRITHQHSPYGISITEVEVEEGVGEVEVEAKVGEPLLRQIVQRHRLTRDDLQRRQGWVVWNWFSLYYFCAIYFYNFSFDNIWSWICVKQGKIECRWKIWYLFKWKIGNRDLQPSRSINEVTFLGGRGYLAK